MTKPKYLHKSRIGDGNDAKFLGPLKMNGSGVWDVYSVCKGECVLFRYGPMDTDIFCTPITTFPVDFPKEHGRSTSPTASVINAAWTEASRKWWR